MSRPASTSTRGNWDLTLAAIAINGWNRLSIAFRVVPGTYKPPKAHVIEKGA